MKQSDRTAGSDPLFSFCPKCGRSGLKRINIKQLVCDACRFTFFLNVAAASVALIMNPESELLVTHRKFEPAKGKTDLPGGFADPGETIETCLVREVHEELNLEVRSFEYFGSFPNTYLYGEVLYHTIDMTFICRVTDFSTIKPMDDISGFQFIPIRQLVPETFGLCSVQKIVRQFMDASVHGRLLTDVWPTGWNH